MTHMNHREKFDAASFILSKEICNRTKTNKQTHTHTHNKKNTNRFIHTLPMSMCG